MVILATLDREFRPTVSCKARFLDLMRERRIEPAIPKEALADGCLRCGEGSPHRRHQRFVAECLKHHWRDVEIVHLR